VREAASVRARLGEKAQAISGADATEARFRSLGKGKAILHLATHGYVEEDRLRGLARLEEDPRPADPMLERQISKGYDPLLLSGLVLAGANAGDGAEGDDGLLTAAEVSWLDLEGVRLVVLSACQTGRGTVASGEGTLGLVRGFRLAGAHVVVASLWKVDDEATERLMGIFYDRITEGLAPARALREAALALREFQGADGRRPFEAPRYWAAFVAYDAPG
jgi:CHAT domain-containing protein